MNYVLNSIVLLMSVLTGITHAQSPFTPVVCEGDYAGHLQGVCTNEKDAIFWSFTTELVKTDADGAILKKIPVANHHGDLCFKDGRVYVAVNLGNFNNPEGNADSWIYEYDEADLALIAKHEVQEVFHGAGGIDAAGEHFFVVGGLPKGVEENYVYEYDADFAFVKKHTLASGWTNVGIQSAAFHDNQWWFGCYGSPPILLRANRELTAVERFEFDCALGIVGIGEGAFLVARGPKTPEGRYRGELIRARPDAEKGLIFVSEVTGAGNVAATGTWRTDPFRFAAASHQQITEEGTRLEFSFKGTGQPARNAYAGTLVEHTTLESNF